MEQYCGPEYDGESFFYATNWPQWRVNADAQRDRMLAGEEAVPAKRSWEYASWIIEAREKNVPYTINANVPNRGGLIDNLAHDGIVEVATMIDRTGFRPTRYGRLPTQMAAICASNMADVRPRRAGGDRTFQGGRDPRRHARPAHRRRVQPRRDPGDGPGALRRRGRLPPRLRVASF